MGHDHHGHHGHRHDHLGLAPQLPANVHAGRPFALSVGLNLAFVVVAAAYGVAAHSIALVADAAHNFGDVLGLALAGAAAVLARRPPSARRTYGLRRATILAAVANAVVLLVAVGGVVWEAIGRFRAPAEVDGRTVMIVAAIGIAINAGSAALFARHRKSDVNVRAAYLHLVGDAAVSVAVVVGGLLLLLTRWTWIDPLVSLLVSATILVSTWSVLRESLNLALDAVPPGIDPEAVRAHLMSIDGVIDVHDLHIWAMSTTETALTAHLTMPTASCHPALLRDVGRELERRFEIHHTTLQVEPPDAPGECVHAAAGTV
jgi:cobalt-zinc-cadmium efflux system protein